MINNGNVLSQTITVPTETRDGQTYAAFTAVQTYTYDSLNRIKDAKEMIGPAQQWKQTFDYDRYGNRRFDGNNTTTLAPGCQTVVCNPTIDPATNKLIGYSFDNAGNTKLDAENRQFIYDGENKQVEVKDQNGASIGKYYYNGDGQRVKKLTATESTVFVYNASGQLVGEYATQIAQGDAAKVSYLTSDHLGSPRITTDANGQVISRRDFQPFGEEIARAGYGTDNVRQKFTGYVRDEETGLDFAEARYYHNTHGRFTAVDPIFLNAKRLVDPQQLNLYIYVRNNPMMYVDPTGEDLRISGDTDKALEILRAILGTDDAKTRITYDKDKGLAVNLTDIDLTKNEGAKLLNDLTTSKKVYEFRIADTAITAGGERAVGDMANLSNNDVRLIANTDKPPSGVDGLVVIDPDRDGMLSVTQGSGEKLPVPWTTAFHELAESYGFVDGSKQYSEAHSGANSR